MNDAPTLALEGVHKTYHQGPRTLNVLNGAALTVGRGEMVALVGPSGSGKSTLLHIAGLLEQPSEGTIRLAGTDCATLGETERTRRRGRQIGFVYQYHHLLPEFSARENLTLPQLIVGTAKGAARERADELLDLVGLSDRRTHRPAELSGGEQQRVAVARALANKPEILIADEPTGNLDPQTSGRVFDVLDGLVRESGLAALLATHNHELARRMDRMLHLDQGRVVA
jgi:lipoprotein-releasing system ATP-binding protein